MVEFDSMTSRVQQHIFDIFYIYWKLCRHAKFFRSIQVVLNGGCVICVKEKVLMRRQGTYFQQITEICVITWNRNHIGKSSLKLISQVIRDYFLSCGNFSPNYNSSVDMDQRLKPSHVHRSHVSDLSRKIKDLLLLLSNSSSQKGLQF